MIKSPQLGPVALALMLSATPLLAQPAPPTPVAEPATQAQTAPAKNAPAASAQAPTGTPTTKGKDSPFDYRASEEISEDLPVSFPVDI